MRKSLCSECSCSPAFLFIHDCQCRGGASSFSGLAGCKQTVDWWQTDEHGPTRCWLHIDLHLALICWYAARPHRTKYDVSINVSDLKNSKIVRDAAICDAVEWCVLQLFPYWLKHLHLISVRTVSHHLFLFPGLKRAWLWRRLSRSQLPANSMRDCVWT